jgi:predicted CoA-binding protein
MSQAVQDFLTCRRLAVIGVSRTRRKYGNYAYRELKARGLTLVPVHPDLPSVDGDACVPSLERLPAPVDGLLVCVRPDKVPQILRQAAAVGIRRIWLQQGAESADATTTATELGLSVAQGACLLMHAPPVRSIHRLHRGLARLFGRLPPGSAAQTREGRS